MKDDSWQVKTVQRGLNMTISQATGVTPSELLFGILHTLIDCTFLDRRQTQKLVWRELICRDTTVFYIT
jgi:hypothetical protein